MPSLQDGLALRQVRLALRIEDHILASKLRSFSVLVESRAASRKEGSQHEEKHADESRKNDEPDKHDPMPPAITLSRMVQGYSFVVLYVRQ
jgi:hypothetical protein